MDHIEEAIRATLTTHRADPNWFARCKCGEWVRPIGIPGHQAVLIGARLQEMTGPPLAEVIPLHPRLPQATAAA